MKTFYKGKIMKKNYVIKVYEMSTNDRNGNQYHGMKVFDDGKEIVNTGVEYKTSTEQIIKQEFIKPILNKDWVSFEEYKNIVDGHLEVRSGLGYRELNKEFK